MSKTDKRKANRIQGGWAKGKDKERTDKKILESNSMHLENDMSLQFDDKIQLDVGPNYNLVEVKEDVELDLNEIHKIGNNPARIKLINNFIEPAEASRLCAYFIKELPWVQRENATPSGEKYIEPRKTCWYGLPYSYSKVKMTPNENWDPELEIILNRVRNFLPDKKFNSVMCNLYEGAKNSIDWHADDEKSLGKSPTIASVSIGCTRSFELCLRSDLFQNYNDKQMNPYRSRVKDEPPFDGCSIHYRVPLNSGSLLIMSGSLQDHWLHRVPKEYHDQKSRINFTFRYIMENS